MKRLKITRHGEERSKQRLGIPKRAVRRNVINAIVRGQKLWEVEQWNKKAALLKAQKGDPYGNLWFKETARNFSPLMAMAAKTTVVEVEELVDLGEIPPEDIHLPGLFVQRIFQGEKFEKRIEQRTVQAKK